MSDKKKGFWGDPVKRLRRSEALSKARSLLSTAADIGRAINDMGSDPSPRNYAALGVATLNAILGRTEVNPSKDDNFKQFTVWGFQKFLKQVCEKHPSTKKLGASANPVQVSQIYGETLVFLDSQGEVTSYYLVDPEKKDQETLVRYAIGRAIWEQYGMKVEMMFTRESRDGHFRKWDPGPSKTSEQTEEVHRRIQKFLKAGKRRTILLHGPPGTGKSWMSRYIADSILWPTLFIDASQLTWIGIHAVETALEILQPSVVIIDDLDLVRDVSSLLSTIDRINKTTRLLLVTANEKKAFDAAAIRAGRFDDIIEVERVLSPRDLIPGLTDEVYEEIDKWPIAFVVSLRDSLEVLGMDVLEKELKHLRKRVSNNVVDRTLKSTLLEGGGGPRGRREGEHRMKFSTGIVPIDRVFGHMDPPLLWVHMAFERHKGEEALLMLIEGAEKEGLRVRLAENLDPHTDPQTDVLVIGPDMLGRNRREIDDALKKAFYLSTRFRVFTLVRAVISPRRYEEARRRNKIEVYDAPSLSLERVSDILTSTWFDEERKEIVWRCHKHRDQHGFKTFSVPLDYKPPQFITQSSMTPEKMLGIVQRYKADLDEVPLEMSQEVYEELRDSAGNVSNPNDREAYVRVMLDKLDHMLRQPHVNMSKANRWLGFIQGVLWEGHYGIGEMREHNR